MNQRIHFLGWDRPLVDVAVSYLTTDHCARELNFTGTLIVVPTAHSGQRLREKMALYAANKGTVVFPGRIVTPDYLFSGNQQKKLVIKDVQSIALWTHILLALNFDGFTTLFPAPPEESNFDWALGVARQLSQLRNTLAEYGYQCADVLRLLGEDFEEKDRWQDLVSLENLYRRYLEQCQLIDPVSAIKQAIVQPNLSSDIARIVVLAVPDPIPLSTAILEKISNSIPVDICVYAPEKYAHCFDDWGRPLAKKWSDFQIGIPEERIHLVGAPTQHAKKVHKLLQNAANNLNINQIAVGVPDKGLIPYLEHAIKDLEVSSHFPGGVKASTHELFLLIGNFQKFLRHQNYDAFSAVVRHPVVLDYIVRENPKVSAVKLLKMIDKFQNTFLPSDFGTMLQKLTEMNRDYCDLKLAYLQIQTLLDSLSPDQFAETFLALLSQIYQHRKLNLKDDEDRLFCDMASLFVDHLSGIENADLDAINLGSPERLEIILGALQAQRLYPERQPNSIDLLGWLELLWEDAPLVIISGMTNGTVPEAIVGDSFLPESLRKFLHMKDNDQRFARDAYILAAITKSREHQGSVDIVVGKSNDRGEPLKPSRLLFLCDDSTLPTRSIKLFGEVGESHVVPPVSMDFRLFPRLPETSFSTISVTSVKDYLSCPFRFFLKHILKMEILDDRKTELDALDFGQVCHAALEEFGQNKKLRDSKNPDQIGSFLASSAENQINTRFGKRLPVSVMIQLETIKQRLKYAAQSQAELRSAGWRIIEVEKTLHIENAFSSGITIRGKVDRIDFHEEYHQFRLIDYKTSDVAVSPEKAHLKTMRDVIPANYAYFEMEKKRYRWTDLQLPLYSLLLKQEFQDPLQCGYFNLPKALLETGLQIWSDLDENFLDQAEICARGVVGSIEKKIFWPASPKVNYDPFEWILLNNPTELVDARLLEGRK